MQIRHSQRTLLALMLSCLTTAGTAQTTPISRFASKPKTSRAVGSAAKGGTIAAATIIVTVRPEAEVAGSSFSLGEIADIKGADKALVARLAAVEVGTSPLPGMARTILPGDVVVHLRANHLDSKQIQVVAPPGIRIRRVGHEISGDRITQAAISAAKAAIKDMPEATLEPVSSGSAITIPTGNVHLVAGACQGQPEQGSLVVPVSLMVNDRAVQTVEVTLRVHRKLKAVVVTRAIQPHEILTVGDLSLSTVDLPPGFTQPVTDLNAAIGMRATRRIQADAPLPADALETPPAVEDNSKVTITFAFGEVRITAPGLARQAGKIGDTIRVYAQDTHKELDAVIVDDHTVRVTDEDGS